MVLLFVSRLFIFSYQIIRIKFAYQVIRIEFAYSFIRINSFTRCLLIFNLLTISQDIHDLIKVV